MPKCALGHDNPPGERFCGQCGRKINLIVLPLEPTPEDIQILQEKIKALQRDLVVREDEIRKLHDDLKTVNEEKNEPAGTHPDAEPIVRELDDKDRQQQDALQELDGLRDLLPVPPDSPGANPHFSIESYPIPNPAFAMTFEDRHQSLDLSKTAFRIRASLERDAGGSVGLVIHPGALINVKTPAEKRWRRVEGGARLSTEAGMVLFDPKGAVNARFDRRS